MDVFFIWMWKKYYVNATVTERLLAFLVTGFFLVILYYVSDQVELWWQNGQLSFLKESVLSCAMVTFLYRKAFYMCWNGWYCYNIIRRVDNDRTLHNSSSIPLDTIYSVVHTELRLMLLACEYFVSQSSYSLHVPCCGGDEIQIPRDGTNLYTYSNVHLSTHLRGKQIFNS